MTNTTCVRKMSMLNILSLCEMCWLVRVKINKEGGCRISFRCKESPGVAVNLASVDNLSMVIYMGSVYNITHASSSPNQMGIGGGTLELGIADHDHDDESARADTEAVILVTGNGERCTLTRQRRSE